MQKMKNFWYQTSIKISFVIWFYVELLTIWIVKNWALIKNKEYLLLLQREELKLVVVGFLEKGELQIIKNKVVSAQVFKSFMKNKEEFIKKFEPFVKFKEDKKG